MKTTIEIRRERILHIFGTDSPPLWLVRQKRDKYLARLKNRLVRILERENNDEEIDQIANNEIEAFARFNFQDRKRFSDAISEVVNHDEETKIWTSRLETLLQWIWDEERALSKNTGVVSTEPAFDDEEMLQRCIHAVATLKTTSIGSLQRSQRLSYTRAEILATEMIRRGIIERDETDKWKLIVCNPKENISETEKPIAE